MLAVVLLSITAPLELSQLIFAIIGALAYAAVQSMQVPTSRVRPNKDMGSCCVPPHSNSSSKPYYTPARRAGVQAASTSQKLSAGPLTHSSGVEVRKPSSQPVTKPTFKSSGWDAEVQELIAQISPSAHSEKVVSQLAKAVQCHLSKYIPEIEVTGFLTSDLNRGTAFGVAVPEVDIVANVSPDVFLERMQGGRQLTADAVSDSKKMQKCTIRFCTNHLVGTGGFKFRRSAFKGLEPKVTLLAAASQCGTADAIPVDFSVNSTTPLYNAALLTECGQIEPRARALILLVRRWAKDRGVCHAAKGHLSPYAWTLIVIYFLQVGTSCGALLPPLSSFKLWKSLGDRKDANSAPSKWTPPNEGPCKKTVGALFKEFVNFFGKEFDVCKEAVSIRAAKRAAPKIDLPIHVVVDDNDESKVCPSIEDPFEAGRNLSEACTATSLRRLWEELARAESLCRSGASLAQLLEPWAPPERASGPLEGEED